jgi:hypothetical protein
MVLGRFKLKAHHLIAVSIHTIIREASKERKQVRDPIKCVRINLYQGHCAKSTVITFKTTPDLEDSLSTTMPITSPPNISPTPSIE